MQNTHQTEPPSAEWTMDMIPALTKAAEAAQKGADKAERDKLREQVEKLNLDLIGARMERGEMHKQLSLLIRTANDTLRHGLTIGQEDALQTCVKSANKVLKNE